MPAAISCVTVPVDDLQKSIAFYRDVLGLTAEEQDEDHAAFDADGVYFVLLNRSEFGVKWNQALEGGKFLVGDKVEITLAIQATKA